MVWGPISTQASEYRELWNFGIWQAEVQVSGRVWGYTHIISKYVNILCIYIYVYNNIDIHVTCMSIKYNV